MLVIDRFEGDKTVLEYEDGVIILSKDYLPENAKEGDVIELKINEEKTKKRREQALALLKDIDL